MGLLFTIGQQVRWFRKSAPRIMRTAAICTFSHEENQLSRAGGRVEDVAHLDGRGEAGG